MATTATLTLTDFLFTRIAEDENRAGRVTMKPGTGRWVDPELVPPGCVGVIDQGGRRLVLPRDEWLTEWCDLAEPDRRLLVECEAKRLIVGLHVSSGEHEPGHVWGRFCEACADWNAEDNDGRPPTVPWPCRTLRAIGSVYAHHPDYCDEWRV